MSRLPTPGGDDGNWGNVLNDFLSQSHNNDGTLKDAGVVASKVNTVSAADATITISGTAAAPMLKVGTIAESQVTGLAADLSAAEKTANKGAANGYAPLDSGAKIPIANLPTVSPALPTVVTKSSNYTITNADSTILTDSTTSAFTLTLPTAVGVSGQAFVIKALNQTNVVTVAATASQTIDGARSIAVNLGLTIQSDGANWHIIDRLGLSTSYAVRTPEQFGAKRDGRLITDATISAASSTLVSASAPFTVADVGKTILISQAGSAIGTTFKDLVTTISAFTDASHVTLATAAITAVSGGFAVHGTNDTTAINAAVTAAYNAGIADGSNYAEVNLSTGIYMVSGATTQGGSTFGNAQIPLPIVSMTGPKFTLAFKSPADATGLWYFGQTTPQAAGGATLFSTLPGTNDATYGEAAVIGGPNPKQGYGGVAIKFSNMLAVVDGVRIVTPFDPHVCGFDFRGVAEANVENGACHTTGWAGRYNSDPNYASQTWQFGLAMPENNNNDHNEIGLYSAQGLNFGLFLNEHTVARSIRATYCVAGIEACSGNTSFGHGSRIIYASVEACQVGIGVGNGYYALKIEIDLLDLESVGFAAINDASGALLGTCNITAVGGGSPPLVLGKGQNYGVDPNATNLRVYDKQRQPGYQPAPAVPLSGATFQNPLFRDCYIYITGGTVSAVSIDGHAVTITGPYLLPTMRSISITYTGTLTWTWYVI